MPDLCQQQDFHWGSEGGLKYHVMAVVNKVLWAVDWSLGKCSYYK